MIAGGMQALFPPGTLSGKRGQTEKAAGRGRGLESLPDLRKKIEK